MSTLNPEFKLEVFEGPLDLLLHLITKNKLNIYDIPIITLVEQYTEYIENASARALTLIPPASFRDGGKAFI